jgi:hypothetical protein
MTQDYTTYSVRDLLKAEHLLNATLSLALRTEAITRAPLAQVNEVRAELAAIKAEKARRRM